jgi:hypothetical protein
LTYLNYYNFFGLWGCVAPESHKSVSAPKRIIMPLESPNKGVLIDSIVVGDFNIDASSLGSPCTNLVADTVSV